MAESTKNVVLFGDSILRGVEVDDSGERYKFSQTIDWENIETRLDINIVNNSKMGCDIIKGKNIIEKYLDGHSDIDIAVVEYGGNDSDFRWDEVSRTYWEEHNPKTLISDFVEKLKQIIALLKARGIKVVLMTLPPVCSTRYLDWISKKLGNSKENISKFLVDIEVIYRYQELYSAAVTNIARETGSELVDVRSRFLIVRNMPELLCVDGIHPNKKGQELIQNIFIDHFENNMNW